MLRDSRNITLLIVAKDILKNLFLGIDLTVISGKQQTDLIFAFGKNKFLFPDPDFFLS